ncbi:MAG: MFS transporter [Emergencia sp.]
MNEKTLNSAASQALPMKVKLSYGFGGFAKALLAVMMAAFMLYFYVDICGLNSGIASTIILIAKIWDIVNDPMMGAVVDRTRSTGGRCRFYLKYVSVPAGVIVALCFIMPDITTTGKFVWVAVTYVAQGMASTALLIPLNTLMGRLTDNLQQRAQLNQAQGIGSMIAQLVVVSYTMKMVMIFGGQDMQKGFLYVGIIFGILYAVCHLIVFWGTKGFEPADPAEEKTVIFVKAEENQIGGKKESAVKALLQNKVLLLCAGLSFLPTFASSIESTALPFYLQYVKDGNMALYSIFGTISTVTGILIWVFITVLVKKLSNAKVAVLGSVISIVGYFIGFLFKDASTAVMAVRWTFEGIGVGMIGGVILLCIFDSKIYGEWKTGFTGNEAILMSGYSVSYKIGMAVGGPVAGYLLLTVPYEAGAAVQAASVNNLFFMESTLFPGILYILCLLISIVILRYERKIPQMKKEIEERKQNQAAQA